MKDVMQKQLEAGKEAIFNMKLKRSQFLVKNMTDDMITVKLGNKCCCRYGRGCVC